MDFKSSVGSLQALTSDVGNSKVFVEDLKFLLKNLGREVAKSANNKQSTRVDSVFFNPPISEQCFSEVGKDKFFVIDVTSKPYVQNKIKPITKIPNNELVKEYENLRKEAEVSLKKIDKIRNQSRRYREEIDLIKRCLKERHVPRIVPTEREIQNLDFSIPSEFAASILCLKYDVSRNTFFKYLKKKSIS